MSGGEERLHNAPVIVMFLTINNENSLAQQSSDWVTLAAPEQLISLSNQHLAVSLRATDDIRFEPWQGDLKKPLHSGK
jgi:hypothetical protein